MLKAFYDSIRPSSPRGPNMLRFRSIDPTAKYFTSGPKFTQVALPMPDKSENILTQFRSDFILATW